MSQNDFNIANQGFPATRADINSALQALASNSAGTAEPSTTYAYQFWYDETNELLKMRNSDNDAWITIGTFDQVADTFTPAGVTSDKIEEGNSSVEVVDTGTGYVAITVDGVEAARVDANGRLGIGTTSPAKPLHVYSAVDEILRLETPDNQTGNIFQSFNDASGNLALFGMFDSSRILRLNNAQSDGEIALFTNNTERMRIDSSGNLLVGKTATSFGATGIELRADNQFRVTRSGVCASLNRLSTDGVIADFYGPSGLAGSIVSRTGSNNIAINSQANSGRLSCAGNEVYGWNLQQFWPVDDNLRDLGVSSERWDDIYATNGTIQTSDRNEKQDIEALSDAEQRVAVAAKGLLRKYRWKDAVAEKGDAARIHFGIIAQDLQAAFEAEGLDAGRYAMFISSTWWEAERVIPAVEAVAAQDAVYETVVIPAVLGEDGNEIEPERTEQVLVSEAVEAVEAQPERTVTDTYQTQEEAPEGAVERTRLGVRYPELLAFIIAAI